MLSPALFARLAALAREVTGIELKAHKLQMVQTRLSRRLRALGLDSFEAYAELLSGPRADEELGEFVNAVTTNLTSFFREAHHFEHLAANVLAPRAAEGRDRLRIWSAGCSTGEEPYCIAMTLLGDPAWTRGRDARILATDLDTAVLAHGRAGVYAEDRAGKIPDGLRARHFTRAEGGLRANDALRALIAFRRLNLLERWPFHGPFDAIFCRNVVIYFDAPTKAALITRFAEILSPGGMLYLGHSESLLGEHPLLVSEGRTAYRRRA